MLSRSGRAIEHFKTFMFHTAVRRGFQESAKNIFILKVIYCCFQQRKNFKNRLTVMLIKLLQKCNTTFLDTVYVS